jgi:signal transduction histidine kinase
MMKVSPFFKKRSILVTLLALPLLLFAFLRFMPAWDIRVWGLIAPVRLIHYYVVSFASFIALITALSTGAALGARAKPRTLFVTLAFSAIAALLLLHSVATPDVLIDGANNEAFKWSSRLSLVVGAIFFALAGLKWSATIEARLVSHWRVFLLIGSTIYVLYIVIAFGYPAPLRYLSALDPSLTYVLATLSTSLFSWAGWRAWKYYQQEGRPIEKRLATALLLLAEAQICQALGVWGRLSWLLSQPLILAALIVALTAILTSFQTPRHLQPARYFAASGSVLIVGLSLLSGELGTRWLAAGFNRSSVVALSLVQGALGFMVLYIIVLRLETLITERTLALEREQHLRNELTRLVVHDLKSPLTVITSGLNLLAKGHLGRLTETQTRLLMHLDQAGEDILLMINDLLEVERLEAGALTLQLVSVDVRALLAERVGNMQISASSQKQHLLLSLPETLPVIRADKELLRRVVNNLLTNALKFTPEEGSIVVGAGSSEKYLTITIADNGPGVPHAEREHIFEKFGQAKNTERRGAGLGLTFCKMAVEAHGGMLTVEDNPGGGALFKVKIPLPVATTQQPVEMLADPVSDSHTLIDESSFTNERQVGAF